MKKFAITVEEMNIKIICINAENSSDAEFLIKNNSYNDEDIVTDTKVVNSIRITNIEEIE